jgi:hypothetical protein
MRRQGSHGLLEKVGHGAARIERIEWILKYRLDGVPP